MSNYSHYRGFSFEELDTILDAVRRTPSTHEHLKRETRERLGIFDTLPDKIEQHLTEKRARAIFAEELAKAPFVPENSKAFIRDLQEQIHLMAEHNDALMMRIGELEKQQ